jgi:hypothetical protein
MRFGDFKVMMEQMRVDVLNMAIGQCLIAAGEHERKIIAGDNAEIYRRGYLFLRRRAAQLNREKLMLGEPGGRVLR